MENRRFSFEENRHRFVLGWKDSRHNTDCRRIVGFCHLFEQMQEFRRMLLLVTVEIRSAGGRSSQYVRLLYKVVNHTYKSESPSIVPANIFHSDQT